MKNDITEALDIIINQRQVKTVFQPIISLKDGSILGHEALSRITCNSVISNTEMLFDIAGEFNRLWELELLCRTTALETAYKFMIPPYDNILFLNVNPNTMHDEKFIKGFTKEFLNKFQTKPENIVFEITERNAIMDINVFISTINHYRSQEYKIAIDDAGAGYSGLNLISDINPDYIKLDMKLIRGIHENSLKYALVKGMAELSKASQINLIAEGIESFSELDTLIELGVQYGQGYYIQKPAEEIMDINGDIVHEIKRANRKIKHNGHEDLTNISIKNICSHTTVVSPNATVSYVEQYFIDNPNLFGLCVVDHEVPLGIITKEKLFRKMSGDSAYSFYKNKPISKIMCQNFLYVESSMPIRNVSKLAMSRSNQDLYDFIVIIEHGRYLGTVTIKDLLIKASNIEVHHTSELF